MAGVQKLEYVALRVDDLEPTRQFCTEVLGMVELATTGDRSFLGCGRDRGVDLVLHEGGVGLDTFGVRIDNETLDHLVEDVEGARVVEPISTTVDRSIELVFPSGQSLRLVTVDEPRYHHPVGFDFLDSVGIHQDGRSPIAPLDLDHITLMTTAIEDDVTFLTEDLGFRISDIKHGGDGRWRQVFTRRGDYQHDVALVRTETAATLHHLAWTMKHADHVIACADELARHGHGLEIGIGRHGPGSSIFAYLHEPGGHRFELTSDVATLDANTPIGEEFPDDRESGQISVWGGIELPSSWEEGT